jgi:Tol biopolymer transport system component
MGFFVKSWSPNGPQFSMPVYNRRIGVGLWIYDFEQNDVTKILTAPKLGKASWSPDKKRLALSAGAPFYDIWIVNADSLSPGQTLKEHLRESAEFHDRLAKADPCNADRHLFQAAYSQHLADPNSSFSGQKSYADLFFGEPGDFGDPINLGPVVNSSGFDGQPSISSNGLELFFASNRPRRPGELGNRDIWVTRRESTEDQWGKPINLGPTVNSHAVDATPCISQDGLVLYFASNRPGGHGNYDLWLTTRSTISGPWREPVNLGPIINSVVIERHPHISADGLSLYFSGRWGYDRPKALSTDDIWVATRASISDDWNVPVNLGPQINTSYYDAGPFVTSDGLTLLFHSNRYSIRDIWLSRRKSTSAPFGKPKMIAPPIWDSFRESSPCLSADRSTLYFYSPRPGGSGGYDLWQAPILHWPDDIEAPGRGDSDEMLPENDKGKEVVPKANH